MAARNIFNVRSIQERKFDTINLGENYTALFGKPESKFTAMFYGASGSGKSVAALQLADYYATHIGKALYNSHEERVNQTIQERIAKFNITSGKLYFGNALSFDEMVDKIQKNYYRAVFIDSVQYMDFTYEQFKQLRQHFAKRKLAIVMVSFGNTLGSPDRAKDLLHASDIKGFLITESSTWLADTPTAQLQNNYSLQATSLWVGCLLINKAMIRRYYKKKYVGYILTMIEIRLKYYHMKQMSRSEYLKTGMGYLAKIEALEDLSDHIKNEFQLS